MNSTKIDEIDAKLIKMLLSESRTSFTDIGKQCNITVGAVRMRYKRLWKEGVINGEVALVNPHALGYRHIIDLGIITESEDEEEVARYLDTKPYLSHVLKHWGKYNFYGKVALRDLTKLTDIIEDLEQNQKVEHIDPLIWAEAVNVEYPNNLVIKPLLATPSVKHQRHKSSDQAEAILDIDEIDRKIATIVTKKSRTPFRQIADQLGVSTKTVIQRYNKLREDLLPWSTITLDLNKLGYRALANLCIKVSNHGRMTEIYNQLLQIPNVFVIIRFIGGYDLYVAVALEDFDKMFELRALLGRIKGIETPEVILTPMVTSWPLHLFSSLLESEAMPKHWEDKARRKANGSKD